MENEKDAKSAFIAQFPDEPEVQNIELGAGCGDFGKQFYPECYLTDILDGVQICPCNHIDYYCSATDLPWGAERFELLIMCNPFGYGFMTKESTEELLASVFRVLKIGGKALILANERNKWANSKNVKKYIGEYNAEKGTSIICASTAIDATLVYPNYVFYQTGGEDIALPNVQHILSNI